MEDIIRLFKSPATSLNPRPPAVDKDIATSNPTATYSSNVMRDKQLSSFEALPSEIINHILTFLPPVALCTLLCTSQLLRIHAHNDLLWSAFVRDNVPSANKLESPSPAKSFKDVYIAHHPYWFLPRHKIWFSDLPNTGKIVIAQYNAKNGRIEAYQLVAEHNSHTFEAWTHNPEVLIHTFDPKVRVWKDDPVVLLDLKDNVPEKRLQKEVAMRTGSTHGVCSMISLCQPIPKELQDPSMGLWPPLIVPSEQRVRNESINLFKTEAHRPQSFDLMSDQTFRVRKWLEFSNIMQPLSSVRMGEQVMTFSTLPEELYTPTNEKPYQGLWVGDYSGHGCEFLLVLQREVYSSTKICTEPSTGSLPEGVSLTHYEKETPEQRDASIRHVIDDQDDEINVDDLQPDNALLSLMRGPMAENLERMNEPEDGYAGVSSSTKPATSTKKTDQQAELPFTDDVPSGRLEAIKLTGDINVPRGEYTWIAEDLGPNGLIRIGKEQIFDGARIVKSWGRIAGRGFRNNRFIPSQLILVSHDTIAQYWENFGHISFYKRINIDDYLNAVDMSSTS
ncbi:hypothetical protein ACLMJK_006129 [Lecanora helva]